MSGNQSFYTTGRTTHYDKNDSILNPEKAQVILMQGGRGCIPCDEYIYTPNGIVEVKDVKDGMRILGGHIKEPYFFEDDVYEIIINSQSFRFSKEHPIWISKEMKGGSWISVKDVYDLYKQALSNDKIKQSSVLYAKFYSANELGLNKIPFSSNHDTISSIEGIGIVGINLEKKRAYELQYALWILGFESHIEKNKEKYKVILHDKKWKSRYDNHKLNDDMYAIQSIRYLGKMRVCGWETNPSNEIVSYCGLKTHNSGKSATCEMLGELLYLSGVTVLDILSAPTNESLYWCINQHHQEEWDRKQHSPADKYELHCTCHDRHPILLVVPEYIEFDQFTLDLFNEKYYTKTEWKALGYVDYPSAYKNTIDGKTVFNEANLKLIEKPKHLQPAKPWIVIEKIPFPRTRDSNKQEIINKFTKCILRAREEHRILTMNPIYYGQHSFHHFKTLEIIIKALGDISDKHFIPLTPEQLEQVQLTNPKEMKYAKNHHRMALIMREFGSVAPANLKVEQYETLAKKAILGFIRLCRHYNISLIGDYQRQADVFAGIKEQRDIFIFKRSNRDLISQEWLWLLEDIDKKRNKIFEREGLTPRSMMKANDKYPLLETIGNDYGYVVFANNEYKLQQLPLPMFHHKKQTDHFTNDTGILWKYTGSEATTTEEAVSEDGIPSSVASNAIEKVLFDLIGGMVRPIGKKPLKWKEAFNEMCVLKGQGKVSFDWKDHDSMRIWFSRKENPDKTKGK